MYQRRLLSKRLAEDPYVGDYKITEEEIGEGSNSVVRLAESATTGQRVVAKILIKKVSTPSNPLTEAAAAPHIHQCLLPPVLLSAFPPL